MGIQLTPRNLRVLMVVGALVGVGYFLWLARGALFPFLVGAGFAFVISPVVERLAAIQPWYARNPERARGVAVLTIYGAGLGAIVLASIYFVPVAIDEVDQFVDDVPEYYEDAKQQIDEWLLEYEENVPADVRERIEEALSGAGDEAGALVEGIFTRSLGLVFSTVSTIIGFLAVPFFVFYTLKDRDRGLGRFYGFFPEVIRPDVRECLRIANQVLGAYVRAQLFLGVVIFIATFVGLSLMGIDFALALAIFAGATEMIPIIGPIIGFVPAFIVVLATEPEKWWWVVLFYLVVQQAENNLLVPRISGQSVSMHPALILVLLTAAGSIFGLVGVLVVVPIAAAIRDVWAYIYRRLGEEQEKREALAAAVALPEPQPTPEPVPPPT